MIDRIKTWTDRLRPGQIVQSNHVNELRDEVTLIETTIGENALDISDVTTPTASPASLGQALSFMATILKNLGGTAHWYELGTAIFMRRDGTDLPTLDEKVAPVADDLLLAEDSEDTHRKKKIRWSTLSSIAVTWANITGKPSTFTPATHTHALSDVTDAGGMAAIDDAPSDGEEYVRKDGGWEVATGGGGGGGGAPTTSEYITSASDGTLSGEVVIPGLAGSPDIAGAGGAGTSEEYDTTTTGLTWTVSPSTVNSDTTYKSHLYMRISSGVETIGTKSWTPSGAFSARCKVSHGTEGTSSGDHQWGLHIQNSDNTIRTLLTVSINPSARSAYVAAFTFAGGSYTLRGSTWSVLSIGTSPIYLRTDRDGSNNISFYYSYNGLVWQIMATQSLTLTVDKIGFRGYAAANTMNCVADWLRTDV